MRLYRRLLKLPHDAALQDDEIIERAMLPSPEVALRITRLRYLALLYKCETVTPWALLRQDQAWCALIQTDLHWLWKLIERTCDLGDPAEHFSAWEYIFRYHRSYWKTLLQRAQRLWIMQHADNLPLRRLHRDVFAHLEEHGTLAHSAGSYRLHH